MRKIYFLLIVILPVCCNVKNNKNKLVDEIEYFNQYGMQLGNSKAQIEKILLGTGMIYECDQSSVPYMKDTIFCIANDHDSVSVNFYYKDDIMIERTSSHKFKDSLTLVNFFAILNPNMEQVFNKRFKQNNKNTYYSLSATRYRNGFEAFYIVSFNQ